MWRGLNEVICDVTKTGPGVNPSATDGPLETGHTTPKLPRPLGKPQGRVLGYAAQCMDAVGRFSGERSLPTGARRPRHSLFEPADARLHADRYTGHYTDLAHHPDRRRLGHLATRGAHQQRIARLGHAGGLRTGRSC